MRQIVVKHDISKYSESRIVYY